MENHKEDGSKPLLDPESTQDEKDISNKHSKRYILPTIRYVNIVLAMIFIDGIVSIVLWLTGGNSEYFVDNIIYFHVRESVFELVLITAVKVLVCAPALTYLESVSYQQIDDPCNSGLKRTKNALHFVSIFITFASFAYSCTKGGLILYSLINDDSYSPMHSEYNGLVIWAVVVSLLQFIAFLVSFRAMRRLKVIRVLHLYNDSGQEVDKDGNPVPKNVDLKRLAKLAKPEAMMLFFATLCLFGSSASSMAGPLFFGMVLDAAQRSMADLNRTVVTMLIIYAGGAIFSFGRSWLFTLSGQRVVARLRKQIFAAIIKQEIAFFDTNRTGELCNRLASDTQVLQNAVTVNMSMLARYLLQMIGSLVFMFTLNPALTGVLLSVIPVVSLGAVQYGKFVKKLSQEFQDRLGDAGTTAEESLSSIRTVRMFSGENKAKNAYGADVDKSYKAGKKLAAAEGTFSGCIGVVTAGAISLVLWYGGKLVYQHTQDPETGITPGVLTAFLLYMLQVAMGFALMSTLYGDFMKAVGASVRLFGLLDRLPKVPNEGGSVYPELDGSMAFDNIKFTYPSRPETEVIKGISFTVMPGEVVALVGPSGGGKSTIVNLIERFYDPDSGSLTLGGHELRDLDPSWFRQKISMVSQEPTLFACSIRDNIAYGRETSMEEVVEVAKQANADEFISTFEEGYNTLVGERGVRLSGGQKQRIAIARALIMDPTILLLDEATSALDAESEHLVQEAIDRAMKGRTVIVIAHRLSTVRNASKVIVIDKGVIAESGTHDELIAKNGVYKRLVLRQLTAGTVSNGTNIQEDLDSSTSSTSIADMD